MSGAPVARTPDHVPDGHASPLVAPVDSSWRTFRSRLPVVNGRLAGSAAGLVGILLAVPLVFLPTHTVSQDVPQTQGVVQFQQSFWSWWRIADTTPNVESQFDIANIAALAFFIASLLIGVAGCVLYAFRRGPDGRILGAAGVAWVTSLVVNDLVRRLGEAASGLYGQENVRVDTQPGGVLQIGSAVSLCVALTAIAWRPLLGLARTAWAWLAEATRRAAERGRRDEQEESGPPPRVGIATIRDTHPTYDQPAWHASEGVGFSDDGESDRDRFRPPR